MGGGRFAGQRNDLCRRGLTRLIPAPCRSAPAVFRRASHMEQLGFFTVADGVPAVLAAVREQLKKGASQIKLAAGVPRSTLSTWPSSPSTGSKPHLIEEGPRGEVELGSAEQPRGLLELVRPDLAPHGRIIQCTRAGGGGGRRPG